MNSTEMIRRVDVATEARLYAVERCMTLMEKMIEDFEDLIVAYNQFSMYAGDEIHSKMRLLREFEEDEEIGALVVFPTGGVFEYSLSTVESEKAFEEKVIDKLGDSGLLFCYEEQDVIFVDGKKYLDGAMVVFKANLEGEVLPLEDEEIRNARIETTRMIRKIQLEEDRSYMFALDKEEA